MPAAVPNTDGPGFSRPDGMRVRNGRIALTARSHKFERQTAVPFICECSNHRCEELIRLTLGQYEAARGESHYIVAPGHHVRAQGA